MDNYKVIFIGNVAAGKTSIVQHYVAGNFLEHVDSTIGASFACAELTTDDSIMKLHIWDTAGQERYRSIISIYYRGADAVVIVCDLTNSISIDAVEFWINDFKERTNNENAKIILVGNKVDLVGTNDEIILPSTIDELKQVADKKNAKLEAIAKIHNYPVFYVSAKDGTNLKEIFEYIYRELKGTTSFDIKTKLALAESESNIYNGSFLKKWCHLL